MLNGLSGSTIMSSEVKSSIFLSRLLSCKCWCYAVSMLSVCYRYCVDTDIN